MALPKSTDWKEAKFDENEERDLFQEFAKEIAEQQNEAAESTSSPLGRGFHAKLHAGLAAEFHVEKGLDADLRIGVFSEPRMVPAVVRFSNGKPEPHPDKEHEPRGIAIKLIGVPGPKLLKGQEEAVTQDFLATSHSVTAAVHDVKQFMAFNRSLRDPVTRKPRSFVEMANALRKEVGLFESARILKFLTFNVQFSKVLSVVTEKYSSTAPIQFGPFAVKFVVQPTDETKPAVDRPKTENFLRDELADRLRTGDILLDFFVQFYVDEKRTPIEDTSVLWEETDTPLKKVAQLRIPRCDLDDPQTHKLSEAVNQLSFSPWHAIEAHRPLGQLMRARRDVYLASAELRGHSPEPTRFPL